MFDYRPLRDVMLSVLYLNRVTSVHHPPVQYDSMNTQDIPHSHLITIDRFLAYENRQIHANIVQINALPATARGAY